MIDEIDQELIEAQNCNIPKWEGSISFEDGLESSINALTIAVPFCSTCKLDGYIPTYLGYLLI